MIKVFHNPINHNPDEYLKWVDTHKENGYLLDRNCHMGKFGGQIHRANCKLMNQPKNRAGALKGKRYKACSTDYDALLAWGQYVHRDKESPTRHQNGRLKCFDPDHE